MRIFTIALCLLMIASFGFSEPLGNGIYLDGVNNYIEIPSPSNLHSTTNLTLEAWGKPCGLNGTRVIYSKVWCNGQQNSCVFQYKMVNLNEFGILVIVERQTV
jgi:hypothetical protein